MKINPKNLREIFLASFIASFIFSGGQVAAAESGLQSAVQDVKNSVTNLANIKDNDHLSEQDKEKQKLAAAKTALAPKRPDRDRLTEGDRGEALRHAPRCIPY